MKWTTPEQLRQQVQKLWDKGLILSSLVNDDNNIFPKRLTLKQPSSSELSKQFDQVREWISSLKKLENSGYRIIWQDVNHRILGNNTLPKEIWLDSIENAQKILNKRRDIERFQKIISITQQSHPSITTWLQLYPLKALELFHVWEKIMAIISWLQSNQRPDIYLRQADIPGVHSKLIEQHRKVLSELFDMILPEHAINCQAIGLSGFCRRYGFRDKPVRIRFRILDKKLAIFPDSTDQDITITHESFAQLQLPVKRVFITENEINFLSFPMLQDSIVIFGAGYGFDMLSISHWLNKLNLYYWGDIDTHGFAILDQLRKYFPHTKSLMMDLETLLLHKQLWGIEPQPEYRDLNRLTESESETYNILRYNKIDKNIRLEQEHIAFSHIIYTLDKLDKS